MCFRQIISRISKGVLPVASVNPMGLNATRSLIE
jgi:hypothetical protein